MITKSRNPLEFTQLMYELEDANEHLTSLIKQLESSNIEKEDYRIQIAHIYAHINRAWNMRSASRSLNSNGLEDSKSFPEDIKPL